jgi:hypothetical protein
MLDERYEISLNKSKTDQNDIGFDVTVNKIKNKLIKNSTKICSFSYHLDLTVNNTQGSYE